MTRYRTIVIDPPWRYTRTGRADGKAVVMTRFPYDTLTVDEIAALPVPGLADDDCRLFLWATNRYLRDAFSVIDAWGFRFSQILVWHKTGAPSPFAGAGGIAPTHAEYLLVANRGHPARLDRLKACVFAVDTNSAVLKHSQKPDVFLDMVESVSPGPYVELFARRARFGWDYWGDQSLGTAVMEDVA